MTVAELCARPNDAIEIPREPVKLAETAKPEPALLSRTRTGAIWSAVSRFGTQGLQFLGSLFLARLLLPSEYGLAAIAFVFIGFAGIFRDLGLAGAVIHRRDLTKADEDTAFWVSTTAGLLVTGILIGLATPLADLFGQPRLRGLIILASLSFIVSVSAVPAALLERDLRFRSLATLEVFGAFLGLFLTLITAFAGEGAASLILGPLLATAVQAPATFVIARWRPGLSVSMIAVRRLWSFSGFLAGFNIVNYFARNGDNLLVGKVLGSTSLGLYNRAYNLMLLPVTVVTQILGRVLFPAYSRIADDIPRLRRAVLASLRFSSTITFIVAALFVGLGNDLIGVLYGNNWRGAGPALVLLAIAICPQIIGGTAGAVYQALGRTDVLFRLGVVGALLLVASAASGLVFGIVGVSAAFTIGVFLGTLLQVRVMGRLLDIGVCRLVAPIMPALAAGTVTSLVAIAVRTVLTGDDLIKVVVAAAVGAVAYIATLFVVDAASLRSVLALLRGRHSLAVEL